MVGGGEATLSSSGCKSRLNNLDTILLADSLFLQLGVVLFGMSSMILYQCMSTYIADTFNLYSASASAACAFLRSFGAFLLPLFVVSLFGNLGYGWGGSIIGLIAIVIGIPTPILLWVFGARLRKASCLAV